MSCEEESGVGARSLEGTSTACPPEGCDLPEGGCTLCLPDPHRILLAERRVLVLQASAPVSPGHCLVVTRRHVPTWWEASLEERADLMEATFQVRRILDEGFHPEDYQVTFEAGASPGRGPNHLHLHVIPRYTATGNRGMDGMPGGATRVAEAPGSSWRVIPGAPHSKPLVRGESDPLYPHLVAALKRAARADIAVAFLMLGGWNRMRVHFEDLLARGGRLRLLTGDYMDATDPEALTAVLDLRQQWGFEARVFEARKTSFHPKCYLFRSPEGTATAFVGSSNLSLSALQGGVEWNYRALSEVDRQGVAEVQSAFEALFYHPDTRPLTETWVEAYRQRRAPSLVRGRPSPVELEPAQPPPEPHKIQRRALEALARTRKEGNRAGLVVMATGTGKTWLAAFDSAPFERVLFVAHREEILGQALRTFRRLRPEARMGLYTGTEKDLEADLVFASVQTLGRVAHLEQFPKDRFDYVVVDEFHHAAAGTYRKLLAWFEPGFLLGLTATPDRTDGADLLTLCGENLVFRCDVADGIREGLLCPFHYYGVPDEVDYRNIPWRNNRFDVDELTRALATRARARNALEQLRRLGGTRTLAFCVSVGHARFMRDFLREQGLRVAAVHSEADSDPRGETLERLGAGDLDVVCAVDMFNEGVDLPALDTVLMLRPTESRILWVQQFGRGLRLMEGKPHLKVIDYIGNHRTFLVKTQTLFDLPAGDGAVARVLKILEEGPLVGSLERSDLRLPPGCEVTYDLQAIRLLRNLLRPSAGQDNLRFYYQEFRQRQGVRPRAAEAWHAGYNPRAAGSRHGSWLGLVRAMGDLDSLPAGRAGDFLRALETLPLQESGPLVLLGAMLGRGAVPGRLRLEELPEAMARVTRKSARLQADLQTAPSPVTWEGPVQALKDFLAVDGADLRCTFRVPPGERQVYADLVEELVEWRLAEYLDHQIPKSDGSSWGIRVSHAGGRGILRLPDRVRHPDLPFGETPVQVDGQPWVLNFAKVAVNVAREPGGEENQLPALLRRWFGPEAGLPGTHHRVFLEKTAEGFRLAPLAPRPTDQAGGPLQER